MYSLQVMFKVSLKNMKEIKVWYILVSLVYGFMSIATSDERQQQLQEK